MRIPPPYDHVAIEPYDYRHGDAPAPGERVAIVDGCFVGYAEVIFFGCVGGTHNKSNVAIVEFDDEPFRRIVGRHELRRVIQ